MRRRKEAVLLAIVVSVAGCGGPTGSGTLQVQLEAEASITDGIAAGTASEDLVDGWSVTFDRYVVVVSDVAVEGGGEGDFHAHDALAVDLAQVSEVGLPLATFERVPAGLWPEVFFSISSATADTQRHASVAAADLDRMIAGGCTYLIAGAMSHPSGQRCVRGDPTACSAAPSIAFDLCVPAPTRFGPCESDTGVPGVVVAEGTTTPVAITFHGDHLFFNGFPRGAEGSVARRAQWLADSDLDADGTITEAELRAIGPSDLGALFPSTFADGYPGYTLGASPIPIETAWDFVVAELKTQGHFQGEGECPIDGEAHAH